MAQRIPEIPRPPRPSPLQYGDVERARRFREFLESHRGESHLAALQYYPDPDAIASAMAYRIMADRFDIDDFGEALAALRSGSSCKVVIYPNGR